MNTKNYPIYHKQINLERFTEVEAPRDRRKVLAIGVSESGHLAMNERFLSMIHCFNMKMMISDDKKMLLLSETEDGKYVFPKSGRIKDIEFVKSLCEAGFAVPCRYIISYSEELQLWVGEYTDVLNGGKQSLEYSVGKMMGSGKNRRKKNGK